MKKTAHSARIERSFIDNLTEQLLQLYLFCKGRLSEAKKLRGKLQLLDDNNPEFMELLHDRRENNKMALFLAISILSVLIDFFLIRNAVSVLADQFSASGIFAVILPVTLIVAEIGIAYNFALRKRTGSLMSNSGKIIQYVVVGFLVALSLIAIIYTARGYNAAIDGSFISFLISACIAQIALLIPCALLHFWIIQHSEDIAETFAYFKYRLDRQRLSNKIELIEQSNSTKYSPLFIERSRHLTRQMNDFRHSYPNLLPDFEQSMPRELAEAINLAMGRNVFPVASSEHIHAPTF